jgi:ABC-type branched-subunit amino acid transport system permease subunit
LWYSLLALFIISMLTWMPPTWENVFNSGLAFSAIFISITLITGMAGQLSLAQGALAGVGAFTAAQLANHLGLNMLVGIVVGALVAAMVAVVLALLSLRLKGLGLTLMTLAAALFFDSTVFAQNSVSNGTGGLDLKPSWVAGLDVFDPNGHPYFVFAMGVLIVVVLGVIQIRKGTLGNYLTAMRGSETGAASIGLNCTRQRIMIFALTTGISTVEGAIQAGMGFVVFQQLLTYAPSRFQGLTFAFFAFAALTYVSHPEGILEYSKRRWTIRMQQVFFERPKKKTSLSVSAAIPAGQVESDA